MRVAVSGPDGFLAWHTRCALRATTRADVALLRHRHFDAPALMAEALADVDAVIHLAGVNRGAEGRVATANPWLARQLVAALRLLDRPIPVVFANSVHSDGDTAFGRAKREARDVLQQYGATSGAAISDVVLPNLFGEGGRPHYNSVVATFCADLAAGTSPTVHEDRELPLLHAQDAADLLLDLARDPASGRVDPPSTRRTVSQLRDQLTEIAAGYRSGNLPDLSDPLTRSLFNTFRSYTFPQQWPLYLPSHADRRGRLVEVVRASGGPSQVFCSTTVPGATRGQHFHRRKVERFSVVSGSATVRLRRLFSDQVVELPLQGDRPAIIDMPTLWAHSLVNTGPGDVITLFYADELHDPDRSDTFPEVV